ELTTDTVVAVKETSESITVNPRGLRPGDVVPVTLGRTTTPPTRGQALWTVIRYSTDGIQYNAYEKIMDHVMCKGRLTKEEDTLGLRNKRFAPFPGVDPYPLLKVATEVFLMVHAGVLIDFNKLALDDEANRLGRRVQASELDGLWKAYLVKVNGQSK